jgi:RluA family pseudouridine synthase
VCTHGKFPISSETGFQSVFAYAQLSIGIKPANDNHVDRARISRYQDTMSQMAFPIFDHSFISALISARLLFEDEDLIAVNKPSGLPSQPTLDPKRPHLVQAIEVYLQTRNPTVPIYVGQHHRLDVQTTGVMVFTKSKRANKGLYWALVAPAFEQPEWSVRNHLATDKNDKSRMHAVHSGGDRAETLFRNLGSSTKRAGLIEARPRTGRRHQIRVHLADLGHPIVGDHHYGSTADASRVMLHAKSLSILHPISLQRLELVAPIPADFASEAQSLGVGFPA